MARKPASAHDIVERIIRYHNKPAKKNPALILLDCKVAIEELRVELAKEMRETFWLRKEVERLHALLKEARSEF